MPPVPEPRAASVAPFRVKGLEPWQLVQAAADFFAAFPWDGPPPDPAALSAEAFLLGL